MTDTVLRILSAKTSDSGRYRCRLRTGAGAVLFSLTANLVVAARQGEARQGLSPFDWAGAPQGRQPAMPSRYGDIPRSGQTTQHNTASVSLSASNRLVHLRSEIAMVLTS